MISFFRRSTIRRDLMTIIMVVSLLSVILTAVGITLTSYLNMTERVQHEIRHSANMVKEQVGDLVEFAGLPNIRRKIIAHTYALVHNDTVSLSCIYNATQEVVAIYERGDLYVQEQALKTELNNEAFAHLAQEVIREKHALCPENLKQITASEGSEFYYLLPLTKGEGDTKEALQSIDGYVYMEVDTAFQEYMLLRRMLLVLAIAAVVMLACYFLAMRMQRRISNPIQELSDAARKVTIYKDYSIRVPVKKQQYSFEVQQLLESFNLMLMDIEDRDSRLMRKNVELSRAKEAAEQANMSKTQFLANISHELRTPLNAIIGFSSIIVNQLFGKLGNDKYQDYATDIHESGVHLLDVINDILDISKAEAGKLSLKLEAFDVEEALKKCKQILNERAIEGGIAISMDVPEHLEKMVADRVRFIQIMLNIMSNAIKFTDRGGQVDVKVSMEAAGQEVNYFTISVVDTGIGMRKEDIDMAFETFGQIDGGLDRKYEGTGLGLPLTKKLVDLHNASIRIDSQVSLGTTVTVRFISDSALLR